MDLETIVLFIYWSIVFLIYVHYGFKILKDKSPVLPRVSLIVLALKNILTLGGYYFYWYITVSRVLNQGEGSRKIPKDFMILAVIFTFGLGFLIGAIEEVALHHMSKKQWKTIDTIHSWGTFIFFLIWAFEIKYKLDSPSKKLNSIFTFFFGNLYLQKILNDKLEDGNHEFDTTAKVS